MTVAPLLPAVTQAVTTTTSAPPTVTKKVTVVAKKPSSPVHVVVPPPGGAVPAKRIIVVHPPAPKPKPKPKPKPAPKPVGYSNSGIANALFNQLNSERRAHGLAALTYSGRLTSSAHGHNLRMAATNDFSHQVPGEASLGARISATGYPWTWCAENIAWGSVTSLSLAESLQSDMYNEVAPDNGHRLNILSKSAHGLGIDVYTGANGKMWITEDFGS